jgi:hypothetical protein
MSIPTEWPNPSLPKVLVGFIRDGMDSRIDLREQMMTNSQHHKELLARQNDVPSLTIRVPL